MRAIHAVLFLLCCTGVLSWAQGIDISKELPLPMTRGQTANKKSAIRDLVRAGEYQRAWNDCASIFGAHKWNWVGQYRLATFMAQIALADPKVRENGGKRLEVVIDLLDQFLRRLKDSDEGRDPDSLVMHNAFLSELAYPLGVLALACGEKTRAVDLFDRACELALKAEFLRHREARDRRKRLVKGLARYLVIFGREDRAVSLLEQHWALLEDGAWKSREAVRGLALFEVASMLEEMGRVPAAAKPFLEARKHFQAAKDTAAGKEAQSVKEADAVARRKVSAYGIWAGLEKKRPVFEDAHALRKVFQALADQLADAWVKQDVEAALKVLKDPDKARKRVTEVFRREPHPRSLKFTIRSIGPVETTDKFVDPACKAEAILTNGAKRGGDHPLRFVRDGGTWKIASAFKEGDDD